MASKAAILMFTLSMPNRSSWNGRWSGEGKSFIIVHNLGRSKEAHEKADEIAAKESYYYNFGDGWGASVDVKKVSVDEAAKARKKSAGFCGYDWMVRSILRHGVIKTTD